MIVFRLGRPGIHLFNPNSILLVLWLFLLVFPKGGFKIGPIPLTWGYLLLTALSIVSMFRSHFRCHTQRLNAFLLTLPFQLICMFSFLAYGIGDFAFSLSFILSFFFFPWVFFIFFSEFIESLDLTFLFSLLRKGVFFVAAYGVFLFIFKKVTGQFIEIPFLTINFHDFGTIDLKHINRGTVFKLISTYNNGNIYGICILMFLPLYLFLERSSWKKTIVILSLILSLSRTVWIGLLFSELTTALFASKKPAYSRLLGGLFSACLAIFAILYYFEFDISFLFDRNLGGRSEQLQALYAVTIFPDKPFCGIWEMVYLSVLSNFGIIGLFSYLLCLCSPILLTLIRSPISLPHKRLLCGLANFLFVSISDGALLYIPVLVFYWFLSSLSLRNALTQPSDQRLQTSSDFPKKIKCLSVENNWNISPSTRDLCDTKKH
jgi:hypothetical protein